MSTPTLSDERVTSEAWPSLPLAAWQETYQTLHLWTQMVGKVRLALNPPVNHWWAVALYVTSRGLSTSPMPYGVRTFEVSFDFINHTLLIQTSADQTRTVGLYPRSVADFYSEFMSALRSLGIDVRIWSRPQEVPNPIPFDQDEVHAAYAADYAQRFWRILLQSDRVFKQFRARFIGKCSPVHFFWGSCDLAVTRFSGRRAPERPGADCITREAYSHEVSSCGFWPGSGPIQEPAYYAYMAPEAPGFCTARVQPSTAWYSPEVSEFLLRYEDVRTAVDPDAALLAFLQSTYEAGANLAGWDRDALER
jgi:hypothetical protein